MLRNVLSVLAFCSTQKKLQLLLLENRTLRKEIDEQQRGHLDEKNKHGDIAAVAGQNQRRVIVLYQSRSRHDGSDCGIVHLLLTVSRYRCYCCFFVNRCQICSLREELENARTDLDGAQRELRERELSHSDHIHDLEDQQAAASIVVM